MSRPISGKKERNQIGFLHCVSFWNESVDFLRHKTLGLKYLGGWIHYISESGLRHSDFKKQACRIIMLRHMPAIICFLVHSELPQHNQVIHQCIKHAETGSVNYAWRIISLWCSAGCVCLCSVHWKAALTAHDDWVLVCGIYVVLCESIVNCDMALVIKTHQQYK